MIDLTGKSVFVKTQEEYEYILNIARLQGFDKWSDKVSLSSDKVSLSSRDIKLPNILIFKGNGTVAYWSDKGVFSASEMKEEEIKLKEAIAHVKYFANNKDRMSLTNKVIESMLLLVDAVESQLKEVE
jgi:hypothetical protein